MTSSSSSSLLRYFLLSQGAVANYRGETKILFNFESRKSDVILNLKAKKSDVILNVY